MHLLAAKNDINGLEALVQGKLNVNALDARRATPLHIAALYGRSEIIEILLKVRLIRFYFFLNIFENQKKETDNQIIFFFFPKKTEWSRCFNDNC